MGFKGFDKDGSEIYETKEEAIARAKMLTQWHDTGPVMLKRDWAPLWLAHAFRGTLFEPLFYTEVK